MNRPPARWMLAALASLLAGCASPYWADRGRDAADLFTATGGAGLGASVRCGPLAAGLAESADLAGLRGGRFTTFGMRTEEAMDVKLLCFGFEWLAKKPDPRGKNYVATTGMIVTGAPETQRQFYLPFASLPLRGRATSPTIHWACMSQVEIQAACLLGLRLGFNPGEALDFLLGWAGIDLFSDDLGKHAAVSAGPAINPPRPPGPVTTPP